MGPLSLIRICIHVKPVMSCHGEGRFVSTQIVIILIQSKRKIKQWSLRKLNFTNVRWWRIELEVNGPYTSSSSAIHGWRPRSKNCMSDRRILPIVLKVENQISDKLALIGKVPCKFGLNRRFRGYNSTPKGVKD